MNSELRQDPVSGHWVIIAPERAARPTDFPVERRQSRNGFCPFCAGNEDKTPAEILALRPEGAAANGPDWRIRVVPNRFPALGPGAVPEESGGPLTRSCPGVGAHEVIIETPRHVLATSELSAATIADVFRVYQIRMRELRKDPACAYPMLFKNVGAAAGASLEHSHSQLIVTPVVPWAVVNELQGMQRFAEREGGCVFCAMVEEEMRCGRRLVYDGAAFLAFHPYASRFPFETWVVPKPHEPRFERHPPETFDELGRALRNIFLKLDKALDSPAYNYIIHSAPSCAQRAELFHWHIEIIPRVTRVAGFEWGTGFHINPVLPEEAAELLRCSD